MKIPRGHKGRYFYHFTHIDNIRSIVENLGCQVQVNMDNQSLAHSRYNCAYHIVFIPKYRRKVMFGALRKEVGEILGKVCKMEGVTILKAATLPEHVHMYVSIPPKLCVSDRSGGCSREGY